MDLLLYITPLNEMGTQKLQGMVEDKVFVVDIRENILRGSWKGGGVRKEEERRPREETESWKLRIKRSKSEPREQGKKSREKEP